MSAFKVDRTRLDGFEVEIFKLVMKETTSEQWKEWLRVPLEHAAAKGNFDLFTVLMEAGADGSAGWRGYRGRTLLGAAVDGKNEMILLALLQAGAKPDVNVLFDHDDLRSARRMSALYVATYWGAEAAAKALLVAGADPTLADAEGFTPLHVASRAGHHRLVEYLTIAGANPNAKCQTGALIGYTPLHLAARNNHMRCVSALLVVGADINALDGIGFTPLFRAVDGNSMATVEQLLVAGADMDLIPFRHDLDNVRSAGLGIGSCLARAAYLGHTDVLKCLLRHGSNASGYRHATGSSNNSTALHFAAAFDGPGDNGDIVRALLEAGAGTEAKITVRDSTPLHIAASRRVASKGTINALLEGGAHVNALNDLIQAPLHVACSHSSTGAVDLLLRWGADETLLDELGQTAMYSVGDFGSDYENVYEEEEDKRTQQRNADNESIHRMLTNAPADRVWRRRGWLVLYRSYPIKVDLSRGSAVGYDEGVGECRGHETYTEMAGTGTRPVDGGDRSVGEKDAGGEAMADFTRLVGRLVGMETECVFRLVLGFL